MSARVFVLLNNRWRSVSCVRADIQLDLFSLLPDFDREFLRVAVYVCANTIFSSFNVHAHHSMCMRRCWRVGEAEHRAKDHRCPLACAGGTLMRNATSITRLTYAS